MYKHLYDNKWLCLKPEKLKSDGVDINGNIIFNKYTYPAEYKDVLSPVGVNVKEDKQAYREDPINDGIIRGWHKIVISETMPK